MKKKVRHLTLTATAATPARTRAWINSNGAKVEIRESWRKFDIAVSSAKDWTRIEPNLLRMKCSESGREVIHNGEAGLFIQHDDEIFRPCHVLPA